MNNVILIGNLAKDPELSYTPNNQTAVCKFNLAVQRPKKDGVDQGADFIRITVWGRQAESCGRYLSKGRQAAVMGRIATGSYKDRDGKTVYTTDVIADRVEFLGGAGGDNSVREGRSTESRVDYQARGYNTSELDFVGYTFSAADDDMPF